jgi:hypothetical protein
MGGSSQAAQLVQAMAGFGGSSGTAEELEYCPVWCRYIPAALLTAPQHA